MSGGRTGLEALLPGGRGVWVPIDHGASDWPVPGLQDIDGLVAALSEGGADAIVAQKGLISHLLRTDNAPAIGLVAHLSVSTRHGGADAGEKVSVGDVEEALARGAHAVSAQVNMGTPGEGRMIERLGAITGDAHRAGVPTLGMVYARGSNLVPMADDPTNGQAHAVRLAFELGCNVAKAAWSGSVEAFRHVTSAAPIPVLGRRRTAHRRRHGAPPDDQRRHGSRRCWRVHGPANLRSPSPSQAGASHPRHRASRRHPRRGSTPP